MQAFVLKEQVEKSGTNQKEKRKIPLYMYVPYVEFGFTQMCINQIYYHISLYIWN